MCCRFFNVRNELQELPYECGPNLISEENHEPFNRENIPGLHEHQLKASIEGPIPVRWKDHHDAACIRIF